MNENQTDTAGEPKNVYGENHPASDDRPEPDIREQIAKRDPDKGDTAKDLEQAREEEIEDQPTEGGMGRQTTPRGNATPGGFGHEEAENQ